MAGPRVLDAPSALAERQRMPAISRHHAIDASVTLFGKRFSTSIREGASAEELIMKVARENGGGVARVYYPEFRTWEIVAVKIGDTLLVKGDAKKVAGADFSGFPDAAAVRRQAIAAASRSEGGIHFSLGQSGIPMAMTEGQGIVFPNAEELRVRKETSAIALWMTAANANPVDLKSLQQAYSASGGVRMSEDAARRVASAHEGVRSEKLLLHDNLLVLDKDTGEIRTVSEYADRICAEGFAAPQFQTPAYTSVGLAMPSEHGVIAAPMDASPFRIPYLFVKVFDGKLMDHVSVQFNLIRELSQPQQKSRAGEPPAQQESQASEPLAITVGKSRTPAPEQTVSTPAIQEIKTPHPTPAAAHPPKQEFLQNLPPSMKIAPETIMTSWLSRRVLPIRFAVPERVNPVKPRPVYPAMKRKPEPSIVRHTREARPKRRRKPARILPVAPAQKPARAAAKPKTPALPRAAPQARAKIPKKEKRIPEGPAEMRRRKSRPARAPSPAAFQSETPKQRGPNQALARKPEPRKKKGMPLYFRLQLLGLLPQWKRRGRKLRAKKSSAV